jgi:hypothetical protein
MNGDFKLEELTWFPSPPSHTATARESELSLAGSGPDRQGATPLALHSVRARSLHKSAGELPSQRLRAASERGAAAVRLFLACARPVKGATVVPLDGAACSLGWARAPASGAAVAPSSSSLARAHPVVVIPCGGGLLMAQEKRKQGKKIESRKGSCRGIAPGLRPFSAATGGCRRPPAAAATTAWG